VAQKWPKTCFFTKESWLDHITTNATQYARTKQFPPDCEATRIRANQLYEEALAEKDRRKQP
jgi:hypothetical protein